MQCNVIEHLFSTHSRYVLRGALCVSLL